VEVFEADEVQRREDIFPLVVKGFRSGQIRACLDLLSVAVEDGTSCLNALSRLGAAFGQAVGRRALLPDLSVVLTSLEFNAQAVATRSFQALES